MGGYISVYESDLDAEASQGVITKDQANMLWQQLSQRDSERWRLGWAQLAYGIGAFLIIGSLSWFTSIVWEQQNLNLFFLASAYVFAFGYAGIKCWYQQPWNMPQIVGGIFTFISICIVPVAIYGLQKYFDYFPQYTPCLLQALGLAIAGVVGVILVPWSFLTAPIYFALFWITEEDLGALILGIPASDVTFEIHCWLSVGFGMGITISAMIIDRFNSDYSFWGYFFGLLAFSSGLTGLDANVYQDDGYFNFAYFCVQLALLGLGVLLQRYAFFVFGGIGFAYATINFLITRATVEENSWFLIILGSMFMGAAFYVQQRDATQVFVFWSYLIGVAAFWSGWTVLLEWPIYSSFLFKIAYFIMDLGLLSAAIYVKERVFLVFGIFGIIAFTNEIILTMWNSWWLPLFLTFIGLVFVALAVYYTNNGVRKARLARQKQIQQDVEAIELTQQQPTVALPAICSVNAGYVALEQNPNYFPVFYAAPQQLQQQ